MNSLYNQLNQTNQPAQNNAIQKIALMEHEETFQEYNL